MNYVSVRVYEVNQSLLRSVRSAYLLCFCWLVLYVLHLCLKCAAKVQPISDCSKHSCLANGSFLRGTVSHPCQHVDKLNWDMLKSSLIPSSLAQK